MNWRISHLADIALSGYTMMLDTRNEPLGIHIGHAYYDEVITLWANAEYEEQLLSDDEQELLTALVKGLTDNAQEDISVTIVESTSSKESFILKVNSDVVCKIPFSTGTRFMGLSIQP